MSEFWAFVFGYGLALLTAGLGAILYYLWGAS